MTSLGSQLDTPEKREPQLRSCLPQMGLWALSEGTFSLLSIDGGGLRRRVLVSGSTPDLECLVSEQGKQALSSIPL